VWVPGFQYIQGLAEKRKRTSWPVLPGQGADSIGAELGPEGVVGLPGPPSVNPPQPAGGGRDWRTTSDLQKYSYWRMAMTGCFPRTGGRSQKSARRYWLKDRPYPRMSRRS
jgi:hypothetical protein